MVVNIVCEPSCLNLNSGTIEILSNLMSGILLQSFFDAKTFLAIKML